MSVYGRNLYRKICHLLLMINKWSHWTPDKTWETVTFISDHLRLKWVSWHDLRPHQSRKLLQKAEVTSVWVILWGNYTVTWIFFFFFFVALTKPWNKISTNNFIDRYYDHITYLRADWSTKYGTSLFTLLWTLFM